ncbi:hypothetical protein BKA57DRAFT_461627 [Linnemannia elongata]|nr:hypothetical protein BKA57DRAFT_461627 [Linnemannia elongata]
MVLFGIVACIYMLLFAWLPASRFACFSSVKEIHPPFVPIRVCTLSPLFYLALLPTFFPLSLSLSLTLSIQQP